MPQIGISTKSLSQAITSGRFSPLTGMSWVKGQGADFLEVAPMRLPDGISVKAEEIASQAEHLNLNLLCFSVDGDIINKNLLERRREIERLKGRLDVAAQLGCRFMRGNLSPWDSLPDEEPEDTFSLNLIPIIEAAQELARYGDSKGVMFLLENRGLLINGAERMLQIYKRVDHPNFALLLDLGNFLHIDEDPLVGLRELLPYTRLIHAKDLIIRRKVSAAERKDYFKTAAGNYLTGAVVGEGDLPLREMISVIKASGFDGPVTIEYYGSEDSVVGAARSLLNVRQLWIDG